MKNTKVLEMIKSGKIEELVSLLEQEILCEENNLTGKTKSNQKFVANHFKTLNLRPTLKYCIYKDNYQYFTDSYVLFKLDKNNYNVLMPELPKEEKITYPNLDSILNENGFTNHKKYFTATNNLLNVIALAKSEKKKWIEFVELKNENKNGTENETIFYVSVNVLELAIRGLNYSDDLICFEINNYRPVRIKYKDSLALVMPTRSNDDETSEKLYVVGE